ncbi:MAG TPA: HIT family protein [Polyangia bacterium]|jgi:histidine triad (HIT) family protein|nr:HIT family protein [Polyangia bacterium]
MNNNNEAAPERPDHEPPDPRAGCVFCAIIAGARAADFVIRPEDDSGAVAGVVAFLDAKPLFKGHVLVVPRAHHETLPDVPADALAPLFGAVQRVARAVEAGLGAHGTFVAMNNKVSQSVPHLHVHVVPRRRKDGLRGFFWPREPYASDAEREEFAARIRGALR